MVLGQRRRGGGNDADNNNHSSSINNSNGSSNRFIRVKSGGGSSAAARSILLLVIIAIGTCFTILSSSSSSSSSNLSADELYNRALAFTKYYYNNDNNNDNAEATTTASTTTNTMIKECTIPRLNINSKDAIGLGTNVGPVLLEGWEDHPSDWSISTLFSSQENESSSSNRHVNNLGDFPQYVKDLTVQPMKFKQQQQLSTEAAAKATTPSALKKIRRNSEEEEYCILTSRDIANLLPNHDNLLFFTNNKENEPFMRKLRNQYKPPKVVKHINSFEVFSAMNKDKSHAFHQHGESWLGQVEGRRMWWFLPPTTIPKPPRDNACEYMTGQTELPSSSSIMTCVQNPGEIIWFPKDWYHATCALDDWTLGIGAQQGKTIRQEFPKLDPNYSKTLTPTKKQSILQNCLGITTTTTTIDGNDTEGNNQKAIPTTTPDNVVGTSSSSSTTTAAGVSPLLRPTTTKVTKVSNAASQQQEKTTDNKNEDQNNNNNKEWKFFDGDLNAYYNSLEKDIDRDPTSISSYAVHRWMGPKRSTEEHYELIDKAIAKHHHHAAAAAVASGSDVLKVFDGGCGLGSGLMWMEKRHGTNWDLTGHTISEEQYNFIQTKLPKHNFKVNLKSYDDIDDNIQYDVIYSIEALIHSLDITKTMKEWSKHLSPGGIVVIIDDYVAEGVDKEEDGIQEFSKSWLANVLITTHEFEVLANSFGLTLVENRDLIAEYNIIKLNYKNQKPNIAPFGGRTHQGWMGSKWRQRLTVEGKLSYNMIVLQKKENGVSRQLNSSTSDNPAIAEDNCPSVPNMHGHDDEATVKFTEITPQLMSGRGLDGGEKMACISGWYCCNKGLEWYDHLAAHRTDNTNFLKLDRNLFGHYIDVFAKHLNGHYKTYPSTAASGGGRFLDIGGTGSTASGMQKVTSKFQHFAGPLEYWKLDSDKAAQNMERTLFCDIDDCPDADTCGFDVTFSHTVLEHAKRPWKSFDTIARITKKGGLTMHLVPWSYQYHATPDDNYRFSHSALITLLEDRGFDVLEVGYDICSKPENMKKRIDEHYDVIWLTYVVGRKR